jgi:endonuclease/exonuclease/phosphatase family metal-dependent hydrolase
VRLLTWNLNGLEDKDLDDRMEAAVFTSILGARLDQLEAGAPGSIPPDVMVFQEVTPRVFAAHLAAHLPAGGYQLRPHASPERETFEVLAYRAPFQMRAYDARALVGSQYSRFLHIADLDDGSGASIRVMTGHFDSGTDSAKIRMGQLRQVNALLGPVSVFAGDANLRKAEWSEAKQTLAMRDAWEVLGEPAEGRYTWHRDAYKARFDRVFVGDQVTPVAMHCYGLGNLPGLSTPVSDHLGLLVDLELTR